MNDELVQFVESLAIPAERKAVVLAELADHVASAAEAAARNGEDPEAARRTALGNLEDLRRSLEAVEPAFATTKRHAVGRGVIAALLVALVIDQGGAIASGILGAVIAVAIAALLAPPRALHLLRSELRSLRLRARLDLRHGTPIGPALAYAATVITVPFLIWIGLIVQRASTRSEFDFDTPPSAFAVAVAAALLLVVESVRTRRRTAA